MKRLALLLLPLLAACEDAPKLPVISLGTGGVRLLNDPKNPREAYEAAYAELTREHFRVRGYLRGSTPFYSGAEHSLLEIAEYLRTMQAFAAEPAKSAIGPYIEKYRGLASDTGTGRPGASWESTMTRWEQEVRSAFSPNAVEVPNAWPPGFGPAPAPSTAPTPAPTPAPDPQAARVAWKAWKVSHAELVKLYVEGRDASAAWSDASAALGQLRKALPADRAGRLELMIQVLGKQAAATRSFTAAPEGGTRDSVAWELGKVAETLEAEYAPDGK